MQATSLRTTAEPWGWAPPESVIVLVALLVAFAPLHSGCGPADGWGEAPGGSPADPGLYPDGGVPDDAGPFVEPGVEPLPVEYALLPGLVRGAFDPEVPPPGANEWRCRSSTHARPVVLVHATFANQHDDWATLAPLLWNEGYCVYTFNYGGPPLLWTIYGLGSIEDSAVELEAFVDEVLARTGADQVDLVTHSQGGLMARYYLAFFDGTSKVEQLVSLGPSSHGTTFLGIVNLLEALGLRSLVEQVATNTICPACAEQLIDSPLLQTLDAEGDTLPGVGYTVIATKYDEIVTPYESQFLEGATNLLVQDVCRRDFTGHLGLAYDPVALQLVLNALDPSAAREPDCRYVAWLF